MGLRNVLYGRQSFHGDMRPIFASFALFVGIVAGVWIYLSAEFLVIHRQLNDALIFFSGMFRVGYGQLPSEDYVHAIGHLAQLIPALIHRFTGSAIDALIGTNLIYCVAAFLILFRSSLNGAPVVFSVLAGVLIFHLAMTPSAVFRAGDISMSYNRWALVILGSSIIWLFSLFKSGVKPADVAVTTIVFLILFFTKITFAIGLAAIFGASLFLRLYSFRHGALSAIAALCCLLLIELSFGGVLNYLSHLVGVALLRGAPPAGKYELLLASSAYELCYFLLAILAPYALRLCKIRDTYKQLLVVFVGLIVSIYLGTQNQGQHKLILPIYFVFGFYFAVNLNWPPFMRNEFAKGSAILLVCLPLYYYLAALLFSAYSEAWSKKIPVHGWSLVSIHQSLHDFYVVDRRKRGIAPAELILLSEGHNVDHYEEYQAALVGANRSQYIRPLGIFEEIELVLSLRESIPEFCTSGDKVSTINWVDVTPIVLPPEFRLGYTYLHAHWAREINPIHHAPNKTIFEKNDCIFLPKLFFNKYDFNLVSYYTTVLQKRMKVVGENTFWKVYRHETR
jgi:hypothetical protein